MRVELWHLARPSASENAQASAPCTSEAVTRSDRTLACMTSETPEASCSLSASNPQALALPWVLVSVTAFGTDLKSTGRAPC